MRKNHPDTFFAFAPSGAEVGLESVRAAIGPAGWQENPQKATDPSANQVTPA